MITIENKAVENLKSTKKPVKQGHLDAQYKLAMQFKEKSTPQDHIAAYISFKDAAEQGDAGAQYELGVIYSKGVIYSGQTIIFPDMDKDFTSFKDAAEQGHVAAQYELAMIYGSVQNYTEFIRWINKAAEQGNAKALELIAKLTKKTLYRSDLTIDESCI